MFLLLGAWLAVSNHCYLECSGFGSADECCVTIPAPSQGDPCETGCQVIEKSDFKTHEQTDLCFLLTALNLPVVYITCEPAVALGKSSAVETWPPETLELPEFLVRTALPVRGPSFIS